MRSVAYALPVKDRAAGLKFVDDLSKGDKADKYHMSRQKQGFKRIKVFLQSQPQEMVIFYLESGDKVNDSVQARGASGDEFEKWLESEVEKITGHHIGKLTAGKVPSELLYDWHPDHGVSKTHHPK